MLIDRKKEVCCRIWFIYIFTVRIFWKYLINFLKNNSEPELFFYFFNPLMSSIVITCLFVYISCFMCNKLCFSRGFRSLFCSKEAIGFGICVRMSSGPEVLLKVSVVFSVLLLSCVLLWMKFLFFVYGFLLLYGSVSLLPFFCAPPPLPHSYFLFSVLPDTQMVSCKCFASFVQTPNSRTLFPSLTRVNTCPSLSFLFL